MIFFKIWLNDMRSGRGRGPSVEELSVEGTLKARDRAVLERQDCFLEPCPDSGILYDCQLQLS